VELPTLRESPMPVLVPPKVSLLVSSQQVHRGEMYMPPSPPSSVSASGGESREDMEIDGKQRHKTKPDSSGTRMYDSMDGKQAGCLGLEVETGASPVPRLSTTSLASSSSSSMGAGSDLRGQSNTPGKSGSNFFSRKINKIQVFNLQRKNWVSLFYSN